MHDKQILIRKGDEGDYAVNVIGESLTFFRATLEKVLQLVAEEFENKDNYVIQRGEEGVNMIEIDAMIKAMKRGENVRNFRKFLGSQTGYMHKELKKKGFTRLGTRVIDGTTYVHYKRGKIKVAGKATCHPNDKFDRQIGIYLAVKRVYDFLRDNNKIIKKDEDNTSKKSVIILDTMNKLLKDMIDDVNGDIQELMLRRMNDMSDDALNLLCHKLLEVAEILKNNE